MDHVRELGMFHGLKAGVDVVENVIAALCEERGALLSRAEQKECVLTISARGAQARENTSSPPGSRVA
jgi:hypothetical protein